MYVPWQIQRDLVRARLDDVERAARYTPHNADRHRRPMRKIAQAARRLSALLGRVGLMASGDVVPAPPSREPDVAPRIEIVVTTDATPANRMSKEPISGTRIPVSRP